MLISRFTTLLVASLLLTASNLYAQIADYELRFNGTTVVFQLTGSRVVNLGSTLTITGPNDFSRAQTFQTGQQIEFDTLGLSDGQYNYEVRALSGSRDRTEPAAANNRPKINTTRRSGVLTISVGQLISPGDAEVNTRDVVVTDDQIVIGNLCVGLDCVNGESFGLDTIRTKENNLRIRFQDTSNSASFPSNDWELAANESTNGGANQFSINDIDSGRVPFIVSAGAPNNTLFLDSSGKVGLGTRTPLVDLHSLNGNTPTLRLEQDGSGGFAAQTWDIGGNETEFFVRDNSNFVVPFRIAPGAPNSSLAIDGNGSVGIGTNNPAASLHLQESTVGPSIKLGNISANNREWDTGLLDSTGDYSIDDVDTVETELVVSAGGDLTISGSLISTRRNIVPKISANNRTSTGLIKGVSNNVGMSLAELNQYIAANQQLPGFEDSNGGHDVVAFQMQLLQTIQQLTLHTVEQQQQIEALQARLIELEQPSAKR